jgi:hypothetical protein
MTDIANELKALKEIAADMHRRIDLLRIKLNTNKCILCEQRTDEGRNIYDKFICKKCDNCLQHGVID